MRVCKSDPAPSFCWNMQCDLWGHCSTVWSWLCPEDIASEGSQISTCYLHGVSFSLPPITSCPAQQLGRWDSLPGLCHLPRYNSVIFAIELHTNSCCWGSANEGRVWDPNTAAHTAFSLPMRCWLLTGERSSNPRLSAPSECSCLSSQRCLPLPLSAVPSLSCKDQPEEEVWLAALLPDKRCTLMLQRQLIPYKFTPSLSGHSACAPEMSWRRSLPDCPAT